MQNKDPNKYNADFNKVKHYIGLTLCCIGATFGQHFNFKIKRNNQKIPYERLVYESVDDNTLS